MPTMQMKNIAIQEDGLAARRLQRLGRGGTKQLIVAGSSSHGHVAWFGEKAELFLLTYSRNISARP